MNDRLSELFTDFDFNGAEGFQITEVCGVALPRDYLDFLAECDGGEGSVGNEGYLQLWRAEELFEQNSFYEVGEVLPGCLLIGTDLSGSKFGVNGDGKFFAIPDDMGLDKNEIKILCNTFEEFIKKVGNGDYI